MDIGNCRNTSTLMTLAILAMPLTIGCGSPAAQTDTPVTESQAPKIDFATAVQKLAEHTQTVKDAFAAGTPETCDGAVHEAAHLLEAIPGLVSSMEFTEEAQQAIGEATTKLKDGFTKIHEGFHGGEQTTVYDDVAPDLEAGLATLQDQLSATQ